MASLQERAQSALKIVFLVFAFLFGLLSLTASPVLGVVLLALILMLHPKVASYASKVSPLAAISSRPKIIYAASISVVMLISILQPGTDSAPAEPKSAVVSEEAVSEEAVSEETSPANPQPSPIHENRFRAMYHCNDYSSDQALVKVAREHIGLLESMIARYNQQPNVGDLMQPFDPDICVYNEGRDISEGTNTIGFFPSEDIMNCRAALNCTGRSEGYQASFFLKDDGRMLLVASVGDFRNRVQACVEDGKIDYGPFACN